MPSYARSCDSRRFLRASEPCSPTTLYRALPRTAVCIARITAVLLPVCWVDRPGGYLVLSGVWVPGSTIRDVVDSSADGCDAAVPDAALGAIAPRTSLTPPTTPTRLSVAALIAVLLSVLAASIVPAAAARAAAPTLPPVSRVASTTPRTALLATAALSAPTSPPPATVPLAAWCTTVRTSLPTSYPPMTRPLVTF